MGYMGFGMRKEVYKRKPKQAFKRIKKHNRRNAYKFPKPGTKIDREFLLQTYHKPTKRFLGTIVILIVLTTIGYAYMNTQVWPLQRLENNATEFENGGIIDHLIQHKPTLDSITRLMDQTHGGLFEMGRRSYFNQVYLGFQSRQETDSRISQIEHQTESNTEYWVENDVLTYRREDFEYDMRSDNWVFKVALNNINELDQSFLEYAGLSRQQLDHYLKTCYQKHWLVGMDDRGTKWQFRLYRRYYEVLFLNEGLELTDTEKAQMEELAPNVYWQKYRWINNF